MPELAKDRDDTGLLKRLEEIRERFESGELLDSRPSFCAMILVALSPYLFDILHKLMSEIPESVPGISHCICKQYHRKDPQPQEHPLSCIPACEWEP